jgi:hypothetical protein
MMKNCGEYVHFEVVDQHILQEIVKIVQKRVFSSSSPIITVIMLLRETRIVGC